jgi:hypothetical protein
VFFLGAKFWQISTLKHDFDPHKGFSMKKMPKFASFWGKKIPNCQIFMTNSST